MYDNSSNRYERHVGQFKVCNGRIMQIQILYESGVPIYEQIKSEIRAAILRGEIREGTMLPSIRTLAKELKIGIITAKRAYDELSSEGFIYTVQGKGVFVATLDRSRVESSAVREIRERLTEIMEFAQLNSVEKEKLKQIINEVIGE